MLARKLPGMADESEVVATIEQNVGALHLSPVPSSRAAPQDLSPPQQTSKFSSEGVDFSHSSRAPNSDSTDSGLLGVNACSVDRSVRLIADAAAIKGQLAISTVELERKSAQLEALDKLVTYLKLNSTLFYTAVPTIPSSTLTPQHMNAASLDDLRESLASRSVEVAFWRDSHEQMATALLCAEEELQIETAARIKCEKQIQSDSAAFAAALGAAENRYSALQEQAGDLIAQTEELSRIIDRKNTELMQASHHHSEYVQNTTRLLEQQELALAALQRHSIQLSSDRTSSSLAASTAAHVIEQVDRSRFGSGEDNELVQTLRLQIQQLEEQLSLQPRANRTNLNPSYQPSSSTSPASHVSLSEYIPPPLPPSELLEEVGFLATNASTFICLASSDPTSLVASVSASLDELGRVHDAAWTRVNDADLEVLEGRLDFMISKFRRVKFLRLQLQKQELEDTKKCRLCQDNDIEVVLLPCGHHCLCRGCAANLVICPLCRASIENRIRTFGS